MVCGLEVYAEGGNAFKQKEFIAIRVDPGANLTYLAPTLEVAEVSDNHFDMLPGQSVEIMIKTKANEEALRKGLKVISLVDAFNDDAVAKSAPSTALADPNWVK